jgi:hypothetical protein
MFYGLVLKTHIHTVCRHVEDILMNLLCNRRVLTKETSNERAADQARLLREGKIIIRRFIPLLNHQYTLQDFDCNYLNAFVQVFRLYGVAFDILDNPDKAQARRRIQDIDLQLESTTHDFHCFTRYCLLDNDYSSNDYRQDIQDRQLYMEECARLSNPEESGDLVFSHFILLTILKPWSIQSDYMFNEALISYEKFNNKRQIGLRNYHQSKDYDYNSQTLTSTMTYSNVTMATLIKAEPDIKGLIRSGINNIDRYDNDRSYINIIY